MNIKEKKMKKRLGSFLLMLAILFTMTLIQAKAEKVLNIAGNPNELGVTTFNPIKVELNHDAMTLIYDKFMEWGADGKFYPALAESWTISDDGLTWKMVLKQGVKFHDGSAFNSEVAKWFLEEMKTGPSAYMVGAIDNVEITGPYTITLHLKNPEPNMFFNMAQDFMCIPSMVAYKKYGEEFGIKHVVGSGPYNFESWSPGNELVLVKNPDYTWGPSIVSSIGLLVLIKLSTRIPRKNRQGFWNSRRQGRRCLCRAYHVHQQD